MQECSLNCLLCCAAAYAALLLLLLLLLLQAHKLGLDMSLQDLTNVFDAADIDHSTKIGACSTTAALSSLSKSVELGAADSSRGWPCLQESAGHHSMICQVSKSRRNVARSSRSTLRLSRIQISAADVLLSGTQHVTVFS
jgi:hypothetical protein